MSCTSPKAIRFIIEASGTLPTSHEERLRDGRLTGDEVADLTNDYQYLEAIKTDLKKYHGELLHRLSLLSCPGELGQPNTAYCHLYDIGRDDVDYILETSPSSSARTSRCTARRTRSAAPRHLRRHANRGHRDRPRCITRASTNRLPTAGHRQKAR